LINNLNNEKEDNIIKEDKLKYNKNRNLKISNFFEKKTEKIQVTKENENKIIKNSFNYTNNNLNHLKNQNNKFFDKKLKKEYQDNISTIKIDFTKIKSSKKKASPIKQDLSKKNIEFNKKKKI